MITPRKLRKQVLTQLHETHNGIPRTKGMACGFVWRAGLDCDIKKLVKCYACCQKTHLAPSPVPTHPWEWPEKPWVQLHANFASPIRGKMLMIVVDSHTKWLEIQITPFLLRP